jgi:hypothetical protein
MVDEEMTMSKIVYVTVKLVLADEADVGEVVNEMDYDFSYENDILSTEIVAVEDN